MYTDNIKKIIHTYKQKNSYFQGVAKLFIAFYLSVLMWIQLTDNMWFSEMYKMSLLMKSVYPENVKDNILKYFTHKSNMYDILIIFFSNQSHLLRPIPYCHKMTAWQQEISLQYVF